METKPSNRQKVSRNFKSHYFSWSSRDSGFRKTENQFPYSQKHSFVDIKIPYNLLVSENILKFYKWKAKTTSKTQQLT